MSNSDQRLIDQYRRFHAQEYTYTTYVTVILAEVERGETTAEDAIADIQAKHAEYKDDVKAAWDEYEAGR